jgi:hypothetical protein
VSTLSWLQYQPSDALPQKLATPDFELLCESFAQALRFTLLRKRALVSSGDILHLARSHQVSCRLSRTAEALELTESDKFCRETADHSNIPVHGSGTNTYLGPDSFIGFIPPPRPYVVRTDNILGSYHASHIRISQEPLLSYDHQPFCLLLNRPWALEQPNAINRYR